MNFQDKVFVISRLKSFFLLSILVLSVSYASAQQTSDEKTPNVKPTASPTPAGNQNPDTNTSKLTAAIDKNNLTAEQVVESTIFVYGGGLGRVNLNQIRKFTDERGKLTTIDAKGKSEDANYQLLIARGESLDKEKIRIEKVYPGAKFSLVSNSDKIFGVFNNAVFTPREDAKKDFQNRIWHGLDALLRYKENGSSLEKFERQKILGVELYVVEVTDKQNRKTRFYISYKSFRVMALEYSEDAIKYKRKFYDYNYAQGTLVPYRTVLWADDKRVEEMNIQTVSFGQKVEDLMFEES
jgi:hypothetical protein